MVIHHDISRCSIRDARLLDIMLRRLLITLRHAASYAMPLLLSLPRFAAMSFFMLMLYFDKMSLLLPCFSPL